MPQITLDVDGELPDDFIVDKVIVIIEGIHVGDDDTVLWRASSANVKAWQTLGMLEACAASERAYLVAGFTEGND